VAATRPVDLLAAGYTGSVGQSDQVGWPLGDGRGLALPRDHCQNVEDLSRREVAWKPVGRPVEDRENVAYLRRVAGAQRHSVARADASEHGRGALDAMFAPADVRPMCARERS
jgi:hypothetical protein